MVFRYSMRDSSVLDVSMYKVAGDNGEKSSLAHTLSLGLTGPFAIHVVDNVIIVHHQVTVIIATDRILFSKHEIKQCS